MANAFDELHLDPQLLQTLANIGHTTPTPVQAAVIPAMLTGHDVIGQSQTGTGKTAAFALPILNRLEKKQRNAQALVVTPTRELAIQVAEAFRNYGMGCFVSVLPVYGGEPYGHQIKRLRKGVDIVVGTPGRLLDLMKKNVLDLSDVSTVVLDEADEMLSMGFIEDVETILSATTSNRQTALFSATIPQRIRLLADRYMNNPQSFTIGPQKPTADSIQQRYYLVNPGDKQAALTRLLEIEPITSALVFTRTRLGTGELVNELAHRGFPAEALNGDLSQEARVRVLNRFRDGKIKVLVATDVAARGLDIDDISHVINFDLSPDPEVYVHRIGRTGRAGKSGIAISLVTPKERWCLRKIEFCVNLRIPKFHLPTTKEIESHRDTMLLEKVMVWMKRGRCNRERQLVAELAAEGHDPIEIAAIALKLARADENRRPVAPVSEVKENPKTKKKTARKHRRPVTGRDQTTRSHEKGMVRLALNTGWAAGTEVKHIVGSLAHFTNIPGRSFGRINIGKQQSYVDVPGNLVARVLTKTSTYKIGRQRVTVELANSCEPRR